MKDLNQVMNKMQSNLQQTFDNNQQQELIKKQVSDNAKLVIDELFKELKSCYPAWRQAIDSREAWNLSKKTWTKAFIENGISTEEQVSVGLAAARKGDNPFWPSVGQFINWCNGPQINTDDAFNRMIANKPCVGVAEYQTRQECSFRCKRQLPEDKARKLFRDVLTKNLEKVRTGELQEREIIERKIEAPEVFRKKETPEQRNDRLDQEIKQMLADGKPLLGPHKKRHNENKDHK